MKLFFFLIPCLIALNSCKTSTSPSASSGSIQDIFPLKVGDQWIYAVTEYRSDGTAKGTFPDTVRIVGSTSFQGSTAFELTQQTADTLLFYYSGSSDLYSVQRGHASLVLHYPMNVGDSYTLQDTTYPDGSIHKEKLILQSSSESVTVPAGTFSTFHFDDLGIGGTVSAPDTPSIRKQYYAPGKGLVQENDYGYDANKNHFLVNGVQLLSLDLK